jgi:hypothetical protein
MKNVLKPYIAIAFLIFSLSACTAGDKGDGHATDSTTIDTAQSASSSAGSGAGAEGGDSSMMDSAGTPGTMSRDTSQKNRSANGAADYKPQNK